MRRRTLFKISVHGLLVATSFLAGAGSRAAEPAGPRVEVEAEEIDLGAVARGATVEAKFRLRNAGDRDLHILEARPG